MSIIAVLSDGFDAIYRAGYGAVYRYFRYRTGDRFLAEVLCAETFLKAYRNFARFDESRSSVVTWLLMLGKSVYIDNYRKNKRQIYAPDALTEETADSEQPDDTAVRRDTNRALYRALGRLGERERNLIALKYSSELKNKEIARITGRSERHTAVMLGRTLGKLKQYLHEMGVDCYE